MILADYDTLMAGNTLKSPTATAHDVRYEPAPWEAKMNDSNELDLQALESAKTYMGRFAWPTVLLGTGVFVGYVATPILVVSGQLSLLAGFCLMSVLAYAAYTVLHDAAHGSISGSHRSLRWLNELMGYLAAWVVMIPLTAHRHEHLAHHRHTNDAEGDPDYIVGSLTKSPWSAVQVAIRVLSKQFTYYFNERWSRAPRSQNLYLCLEIAAALAPRLAFLVAGFWVEGLVLFVLAEIVGVVILLYLFAYIVHKPHESVGRYVDTSTIVARGPAGKIVSLLWGYQNYHSIHHLFPRVPFYTYPALFEDIEDVMRKKGAPIYTIGVRGIRADEPVLQGLVV